MKTIAEVIDKYIVETASYAILSPFNDDKCPIKLEINPRILAFTIINLATILKNAITDSEDGCKCIQEWKNGTCWICEANEILKELGYLK